MNCPHCQQPIDPALILKARQSEIAKRPRKRPDGQPYTRPGAKGLVRSPGRPKRATGEEGWRDALKEAEWGGNRGERVCPVCRRLDFEGHKSDCLLANALAKADGKPTAISHPPTS